MTRKKLSLRRQRRGRRARGHRLHRPRQLRPRRRQPRRVPRRRPSSPGAPRPSAGHPRADAGRLEAVPPVTLTLTLTRQACPTASRRTDTGAAWPSRGGGEACAASSFASDTVSSESAAASP
jgi:hypothetical protein